MKLNLCTTASAELLREQPRQFSAAAFLCSPSFLGADRSLRHSRPSPIVIRALASGRCLKTGDNVLLFGRPGGGKTHLAVAVASRPASTASSLQPRLT